MPKNRLANTYDSRQAHCSGGRLRRAHIGEMLATVNSLLIRLAFRPRSPTNSL